MREWIKQGFGTEGTTLEMTSKPTSISRYVRAPGGWEFLERKLDAEGKPLNFPLCPQYTSCTSDVEIASNALATVAPGAGDLSMQLCDVRSKKEFTGGPHEYNYDLPCGRIPGALWAHWGPSTYEAGDFYCHVSGELHPLHQT